MIDNRIERDTVRISREGQIDRPAGPPPSWIPPVLKNLYGFMRRWSGAFSDELDPKTKEKRREEMEKVVSKSFREQV